MSDIQKEFSNYSLNALQMNLKRLSRKEKVQFVMKGFYLIIPPEYQNKKILPPELFLDSLFKYLERPYYLGLLSAAALHGASHQQAMESYVFINKPPIRPTNVEGLKINYVVKSEFPEYGLEQRKTASGYINIFGPELTALDLVEYHQRVGGLSRVSTILYELSESMQSDKLKEILKNKLSLSSIQRLGYILDVVLDKKEISSVLKKYLSDKIIFRVPLKSGLKKVGFQVNSDWNIIENYKIETDF
jgi:predicted transcriptional regulator of viral defense system